MDGIPRSLFRVVRSLTIWFFRWMQHSFIHVLRTVYKALLPVVHQILRRSRSKVGHLMLPASKIYRFLKPYVGPLIPIVFKIIQFFVSLIRRLFSLPTIDDKAVVNAGPRGLQNLGNTCYFNAVMQSLCYTNSLRDLLRSNHTSGELTDSLRDFYANMLSGKYGSFSPSNLHKIFGRESSRFDDRGQHDSHECLRHFLDNIRKEERRHLEMTGGGSSRNELTLVDSVFGGHLMTVYVCLACEGPYHVCEPCLDLSLPICFERIDQVGAKQGLSRSGKGAKKREQDNELELSQDGSSEIERNSEGEIRKKQEDEDENSDNDEEQSINEVEEVKEEEDDEEDEKAKEEVKQKVKARKTNRKRTEKHRTEKKVTKVEDSENGSCEESEEEKERKQQQRGEGDEQETGETETDDEKEQDEEYKKDHTEEKEKDESDEQRKIKMLEKVFDGEEKHDKEEKHKREKLNGDEDIRGQEQNKEKKSRRKKLRNSRAVTGELGSSTPLNDDWKLHEVKHKSRPQQRSSPNLKISQRKANTESEIKASVKSPERSDVQRETRRRLNKPEEGEERTKENDPFKNTIRLLMQPLSTYTGHSQLRSDDNKPKSIEECLLHFTRMEHINKEYLCNDCYGDHLANGGKDLLLTSATKQTLIFNPSAVLTLHLKRFELKPGGSVKRSDMITYGELLDVAPYCSSMCLRNQPPCSNIWYSLYAVVVHSGSLEFGHYIAYVKVKRNEQLSVMRYLQTQYFDRDVTKEMLTEMAMNKPSGCSPTEGVWYCANDSSIREASLSEVLNQEAYLLFYERL